MSDFQSFVLASGSPSRAQILEQLGYRISEIFPQNIDESELKKEVPRAYIKRICQNKLSSAVKQRPNQVILGADTIVAVGRKILQKAQTAQEQASFMQRISGRRHYSMTAVGVYDPLHPQKITIKLVETLVQMKRLTNQEIQSYVASNVWKGCSGYKFDYAFQSLVKCIDGSVSSIQGLPIYEAKNMLGSAGVFPENRLKTS
jgi:septum formation protein